MVFHACFSAKITQNIPTSGSIRECPTGGTVENEPVEVLAYPVQIHDIVFPLEVLQVLFFHILDIERMSVVIFIE